MKLSLVAVVLSSLVLLCVLATSPVAATAEIHLQASAAGPQATVEKQLDEGKAKCVVVYLSDANHGVVNFIVTSSLDAPSRSTLAITTHYPDDNIVAKTDKAHLLEHKQITITNDDKEQHVEVHQKLAPSTGVRQEGFYSFCFSLVGVRDVQEVVTVQILSVDDVDEAGEIARKGSEGEAPLVVPQKLRHNSKRLRKAKEQMDKVVRSDEQLAERFARMRKTAESTFTRIWMSAIVVITTVVGTLYASFKYTKVTLKKRKLV